MDKPTPPLGACCVAEMLGTFILVFFGCGAVHTAVLTGAEAGVWQVAIVWGVAIMLAVYIFGGISGAHINPAITIALAIWGRCPRNIVFPYVVSQFAGAFLAAAALFLLYQSQLTDYERAMGVQRGEPGSEITAMCYGEYFPNPGVPGNTALYLHDEKERLPQVVSRRTAVLAEVLGTLILAVAVFALTDRRNPSAPPAYLAPVFIGLTVAILISVIAPLTQACFNPARDFGPRLFASLAGWGRIALPGPNGIHAITVYVAAPVIGAAFGGGLYAFLLRPYFLAAPSDNLSERPLR